MLQCCPNGARAWDAHPAIPLTPQAMAHDAHAVAKLGVTSVHVHPRDANKMETLDAGIVGEVVREIRLAAPGVEVGVTTARWVQPDPRKRIEAVRAWGALGDGRPDVASVNVHEKGWDEVCAALHEECIGVELGVWTSGDAVRLRQHGVPPGTVRVLAEVTSVNPDTVVFEAAKILRELGRLDVPILLHGEEGGAWPVLEYAVRRGLDTRIGFEDVLHTPRGYTATDNEELVRKALEIKAPRGRRR